MERGNVETEFKLVLPDAAAFAAVLAALGECGGEARAAILQTNHFFDTDARALRAAGLSLRLREAEGRWRLTLKGKGRASGVVTARPEEEIEVRPADAEALLAGTLSPLPHLAAAAPPEAAALLELATGALGGRPVRVLGSFRNERTRVTDVHLPGVPAPLLVELDRTHFPGERTDLELELEVTPDQAEPVRRALLALFARLDLPVTTAPSKAARFFALSES